MKTVLFILLFLLLAICAWLHLCNSEVDQWDEMYQFWGRRPGEKSYSFEHRYGGVSFPVHVIVGEKQWVFHQIEQGNCFKDSPTEVDISVAKAYSQESYVVWRSREVVDFLGTRYQAVTPTYIIFSTGDCLIYLYDWYNMCTMDAIPPPARVIEPLFEK